MQLRRVALGLVVALAAIGSSFAIATPASAVNHIVGHPGSEQRCYASQYLGCLYYDTNYTSHGYFGAWASYTDLINSRFTSGEGAGQIVKNNSNFMYCTVYINAQCTSFWGEAYTGNFDYENMGNIGQLWYTINDNASLWLT